MALPSCGRDFGSYEETESPPSHMSVPSVLTDSFLLAGHSEKGHLG